MFTRSRVETAQPRGPHQAAIFCHFSTWAESEPEDKRQNMSHYQAPEPSTPLTSPVGILVPTPAGPQALFSMARSHNPGVPFQSILAEEFTAGMLFTCIFGPSQSFGSQEHTDCDISSASLTCLESMQEPRLYTMCLRPSVTPSRLGLSSGNPERRWKHSSPAAALWQPGAPANCCAGSGWKLALCRSRTAIPGGLLVKRSFAGSPRTHNTDSHK